MRKENEQQGRKIRVAVLYGGRSTEHEVSIRSATNVIQNLDRSLFDVVPIGIDKAGSWFLGEDITKQMVQPAILALAQASDKRLFTPDLIGQHPAALHPQDLISTTKNSERLFDVVFPVIHGVLCEDGTVQGLLELAEVPYVGCGVLASAVGMDKDISKRLIMEAGLNVAPYLMIKQGQWNKEAAQFCALVNEKLRYPLFVKPANTGSSVGVQKIKDTEQLAAAIEIAFIYDTKVLVEQGIDGIDVELSVLEALDYGAPPIVSIAGEIRPQNGHEFYSYESKYLDEDGAAIIIPAPVTQDVHNELKQVAKKIFAALDCESMARVDLFLEKDTNKIYFNEVNTLPGYTEISMYPKLMAASGVNYSDLLTHLIQLAMARHGRRSVLSREYRVG
jgi:D-alanine-D-alanine ligase